MLEGIKQESWLYETYSGTMNIGIMRFNLTLIFFAMFLIANAQDIKKKTTKNRYPSYKETYYVLKQDESIRHGDYQKAGKEGLLVKGQYENGNRSGVWEYYGWQGELEQKYDFSTKELLYDKYINKSPNNSEQSEYNRSAIFLGGMSSIYRNFPSQLRYPADARRYGIEGKVYVTATITKDGRMINEKVTKGIGGGCDEEALRVIKLVPDNWIPALDKNNQPVESEITLPITFKLG